MKKNRFLDPVYCLLAAMIWGLAFVAQKQGAYIGTFTFNFARMIIGGLVLIPLLIFNHIRKNKKLPQGEQQKFDFKGMIKGGTVCGFVLFVASNLQQYAFNFEIETGKVAFITALYMMIVPVLGLFLKKKPPLNVWIGVAFGVVGLYFICVKKGDFKIGGGELFALLCALVYAVHIIVIDKFCNTVDGTALACGQFLVAGIFSMICMFIFEEPKISNMVDCAVPILYAGVCSCGIAYTLQIFGQKHTPTAVAALLFCLESVFGVVFGWIILHDSLNMRALVGCVVMFIGVVFTQIPTEVFNKKRKE